MALQEHNEDYFEKRAKERTEESVQEFLTVTGLVHPQSSHYIELNVACMILGRDEDSDHWEVDEDPPREVAGTPLGCLEGGERLPHGEVIKLINWMAGPECGFEPHMHVPNDMAKHIESKGFTTRRLSDYYVSVCVPTMLSTAEGDISRIRDIIHQRIVDGQPVVTPQDCLPLVQEVSWLLRFYIGQLDLIQRISERWKVNAHILFGLASRVAKNIEFLKFLQSALKARYSQEDFYLGQVVPHEYSILKVQNPTLFLDQGEDVDQKKKKDCLDEEPFYYQ